MNSFIRILEILDRHAVEYVVVGGAAAVIHGAPVLTFDLDTLVRVTQSNAERLLRVFAEIEARYRGHTVVIRPELPDIMAGRHLLLTTRLGQFDVLGSIGQSDRFDDLRPQIVRIDLDGISVPVLGLQELIRQKRVMGRDKDRIALRMLEDVARQRGLSDGG